MFIGRRAQIGIAIEGTPGTPVEPTHYIPFLDCSLIERHTPIADQQAKGVRDLEGNDSVEGKKWGEGDIEVVLDPTTAPYWFALALGEINSAPSGGKYVHTITEKDDNEPLTATIWRGRVVDNIEFANAVVDTLELSFADDVAKLKAKIFSKFPTTQSRSPSMVALEYFTFKNAQLLLGDAESPESPEATIEYKVREFKLVINNNSEMIYAPNSNDVDRIASKGLRVTGSFKILFENDDQRDAFKNVAKQIMKLTLTGAAGDIIEINIPSFRIDNWSADTKIDDLAQEGIDFVAEYSDLEDETIDAVITNEVDDYES
jgi:hypothetical protein